MKTTSSARARKATTKQALARIVALRVKVWRTRNLRRTRDWVATKTGISARTIERFEHAQSLPSLHNLWLMQRARAGLLEDVFEMLSRWDGKEFAAVRLRPGK